MALHHIWQSANCAIHLISSRSVMKTLILALTGMVTAAALVLPSKKSSFFLGSGEWIPPMAPDYHCHRLGRYNHCLRISCLVRFNQLLGILPIDNKAVDILPQRLMSHLVSERSDLLGHRSEASCMTDWVMGELCQPTSSRASLQA